MSEFRLVTAGLVDFHAAWEFQREMADSVAAGAAPCLILLQHPPVFTLGKNADKANVLTPGDIPVVPIDRGGDVTYHGPGQLMGYPILNLRERRLGIRDHVLRLERALIATLADFGIAARRRDDCVGVWTDQGKIASLGVRVALGITRHGFALNVCTDLEPFSRINPCGVARCAVTSVSRELGRRVEVDEVAGTFIPHFAREFRFASWAARPASFACGAP